MNPIRDLEIIADELRFKDIEKLNKELEKLEKTYIRGNDKKLKIEYVSTPPDYPNFLALFAWHDFRTYSGYYISAVIKITTGGGGLIFPFRYNTKKICEV